VTEHQSACPTLVLPEGVRDLAAALPAKKRRKLNLARNRVERRGGATVERADAGGAGAVLDMLLRLHGARWQARGEEGLAADERVPPFQRDAAPGSWPPASCVSTRSASAAEPAAAYFGLLHRGRAYAYFTGFDPRFAFESPGALLFAHAWQDALDEGAREIHLCADGSPTSTAGARPTAGTASAPFAVGTPQRPRPPAAGAAAG
jgi:CelD/BcsL family acetyltransferase involved in cellulose biosynthesis